MSTKEATSELAIGEGIDLKPGPDWEVFARKLEAEDRASLYNMLGIVAGNLVVETQGTEDSGQVRETAGRFIRSFDPAIVITHRGLGDFIDGVDAAIKIRRAEEDMA